jgi:hypothetical protein
MACPPYRSVLQKVKTFAALSRPLSGVDEFVSKGDGVALGVLERLEGRHPDRILDWRNPHEPIINQLRISWLTGMITKTGKVNGGKRPGAGRRRD